MARQQRKENQTNYDYAWGDYLHEKAIESQNKDGIHNVGLISK